MFFDKVLGYDLIRFNLLSDVSGKQNSVFWINLKNKFLIYVMFKLLTQIFTNFFPIVLEMFYFF